MKSILKLQKPVLLALLIMTSGLSLSAQTRGSGNLVKQDRTLAPFTEIEAGSAFEILLTQGEPAQVTVETDDNYLDKVQTIVENNRLVITSDGLKNPTAMKVFIKTPGVKLIELDGAARLNTEGEIKISDLVIIASGASKANMELDVQALKSEISGAARLKLKGKAARHLTTISGAAFLEAMELFTQTTEADVSGAAKAKVYAISELKADISGAGSLTYFDDSETPKINEPGTYSFQFENPETPDAKDMEDVVSTTEYGDSTLINIGDIELKVFEGDNTTIKIGDRELEVDEEGNVDFKRDKSDRFDGHWGGFDMGINGYLNKDMAFDIPEDYSFLELRYEKSINVALNIYEQNFNLIGKNFGLTTGLGFEWNNYRFDNNVLLVRDTLGFVDGEFLDTDGINYTKSKLVVNYLTLPVLLEYQTNRFANKNSFHISAGILAGLRIGSHSKIAYNDGAKQKDKYNDKKDYDINPFKLDLTARIGWGKVNLYANYSLTTLFKDNRGPDLYPFAAGITLTSW
ncbi:MAG: DUF2807 domain-containing protein [Bacteroidota bacterium]